MTQQEITFDDYIEMLKEKAPDYGTEVLEIGEDKDMRFVSLKIVDDSPKTVICCLMPFGRTKVMRPKVIRTPAELRQAALEVCNELTRKAMTVKFSLSDDGWIDISAASIHPCLEGKAVDAESQYVDMVVGEILSLYQDIIEDGFKYLSDITEKLEQATPSA